MTERGLSDSIKEYIEKDEKDAILELVNFQIEKTQKHLKSMTNFMDDNQIEDEIRKFRKMRIAAEQEEAGEIKEIFNKVSQKSIKINQSNYNNNDDIVSDENDDDEKTSVVKIKPKSKAKSSNFDDDEDYGVTMKMPELKTEEFVEEEVTASKRGKGSRGGRGSRGSRGGRGRGASQKTASNTTKNQTQLDFTKYIAPKQEPISQISANSRSKGFVKSDSDSDIELLQTNTSTKIKQEPLSTRKNNINSSVNINSQKPSQQAINASKSRIQYEDDSDDNQTQQVTFEAISRNKTKKTENVNDEDDDDDDDEFSIFKRVNNPKRRKV